MHKKIPLASKANSSRQEWSMGTSSHGVKPICVLTLNVGTCEVCVCVASIPYYDYNKRKKVQRALKYITIFSLLLSKKNIRVLRFPRTNLQKKLGMH